MKPECIAILMLTGILSMPLLGQAASLITETPRHEVTIDGTATMVGRWVCSGEAKVEIGSMDHPMQPIQNLEPGIQTISVTTSVPQIDCGDSSINKHMRKALKGKEYPEVSYVAQHYTVEEDGAAVQTRFRFSGKAPVGTWVADGV